MLYQIKTEKNRYIDANNLYGHSMSQSLPHDEIRFDRLVNLEDKLKTPDDSDNGCFVDVNLYYPDNIKEKIKNFSIYS